MDLREREERKDRKREVVRWRNPSDIVAAGGRQTNLFKNVASNVGKRDGGVDITDIYKSSSAIVFQVMRRNKVESVSGGDRAGRRG